MRPADFVEIRERGTPGFPVELYDVTNSHVRYIMPFHWHREIELIAVEKGELLATVGEAQYRAAPGDVLFVGSGVLHGGVPRDCVYSCVVFDASALFGSGTEWAREISGIASGAGGSVWRDGSGEINDLIRSVIRTLREKKPGYRSRTVGLICTLFGCMAENGYENREIGRHGGAGPEKMKAVLGWIEEHYTETVTLDRLAAAAGMNPQYFCDFFRKYTRHRPIEYLNMYRVDCACRLLITGNCTVTDAAFASGFNDLCYFTKLFRRYKGITPMEYKRIMPLSPEPTEPRGTREK